MTISNAFNSLLANIEPTERDIEIHENHQHSVTRRLETAFAANRVELIGSYCRGSSIRHTSDIDLLLVMSRDEVRWGENWKSSTTVLGHVRDELLRRYPNTNVVRDAHAVVVGFADKSFIKHSAAFVSKRCHSRASWRARPSAVRRFCAM